jgi:hypothetical protein
MCVANLLYEEVIHWPMADAGAGATRQQTACEGFEIGIYCSYKTPLS